MRVNRVCMSERTEQLHEAVKWVSRRRQANPEAHTRALVEEAGRRFHLTDAQKEWLLGSIATTPRHN
jgi:hypothetical protein